MDVKVAARRLTPLGRAGAGLAVSALVLAAAGLALPGFPVFFPLVSLWCNAAVIIGVLWALRIAGVRLDLFHWGVLAVVWAAALVYTFFVVENRTFIYYWDYSNYIFRQYEAEAAFRQSAAAGFGYVFGSITEDYTSFLTLFAEFPFCLTAHTGDSYTLCQLFSTLPALLIALAGLTVKAGQMLRVRSRFYYYLIGLSWLVTYPFLRMSALLGQPDWFGLIFAFTLVTLTLDYRFERVDIPRFVLIFLSVAALILTRRWYLYFVVGYIAAYVLLLAVHDLRLARRGQKKEALRRAGRLAAFGLTSIIGMVALLWPMVRTILAYDYASHYSYYNAGGMAMELFLQFFRIGVLNFILIGLGLWYALRRRQTLPCLAGAALLISMVLFTRVQNTGSHQMLLFVPGWFLLFLCGAAALAGGIRQRPKPIFCFWAFTLVFALAVRISPMTIVALPGVVIDHFPGGENIEFIRLDDLTVSRSDTAQMQQLDDWLDAHCGEGEFAWMIPHDTLYNTDQFQNLHLPQVEVEHKLQGGFSIPGTHSFPTAFFEAKYVLTADPHPQTLAAGNEMSGRWDALFAAVRDERFVQAAQFDMGNGTVFTVWQRVEAAGRAEVEYYLAGFAAEDAQYPEMFSEIAERWLLQQGL